MLLAAPIVILVLAVFTIVLQPLGGPNTQASHGGSDLFAIDMDTSQAAANDGTSISTIETCARINENDIMDADEVAVDTLLIDVVVDNIPATLPDPAIATSFRFNFPTPNVTLQQKFDTIRRRELRG